MTSRDLSKPELALFLQQIGLAIPGERILLDDFSRRTHGADASFYRLVPQAVLLVETEDEVVAVCRAASAHRVPITFRAAGTSLSGQGVTDWVLVKLGRNGWRWCEALEDGAAVRLGPAMIAGHVNARLARYDRKIGPDPASLGAAMIGGIAANNSSGMCCGTAQNAYKTLRAMRVILLDGTILDTADAESRASFARSRPDLLAALSEIARLVREDADLRALIGRKYAIKNTTGYSLNALVDFADPIEMLQHLMIGSEGTLGFISDLTLDTVAEPRLKAAALVLFPDMHLACSAATKLGATAVSAVEVMDTASLRSAVAKPGAPSALGDLADGAAALLVDVRATSPDGLAAGVDAAMRALADYPLLDPVSFSSAPDVYSALWNIRKGLLPAVGALRPPGTTVIVEDIAVPLPRLADAAIALRRILDDLGYEDAIIFGHALDGNLHFVFAQSFGNPEEVERYARLIDAVARMITKDFHGSLKAEHGTGRNMAPFVEEEWGRTAYRIMRRIKHVFDPLGLLNPDVLISSDPLVHLKALKSLPDMDSPVTPCIECGFCEPVCPSRDITLTPRQRIVAMRAMAEDERLADDPVFQRAFDYQAVDTCAGDGLCGSVCPVGIDTGSAMRSARASRRGGVSKGLATAIGRSMGFTIAAAKIALGTAEVMHTLVGTERLQRLALRWAGTTRDLAPGWTRFLPRPGKSPPSGTSGGAKDRPAIVLFSSCTSVAMAPARDAPDQRDLWAVVERLFDAAGYDVIHAAAGRTACCGMPFASKGLPDSASDSLARLRNQLETASKSGAYPIVSDTSACSMWISSNAGAALPVLDITEALYRLVLPKLIIRRKAQSVALHVTCSTRKLGLADQLVGIARACADEVIIPHDIPCCGFAGDKGFSHPELNANALRTLADQLPPECSAGYSSSRTCEIGLSIHSGGRHYQSIAYLLAWCIDV